jgi:MFS family permease
MLLMAFVWKERTAPAPLIDLHLFRSPAFSGGSLAVALAYAMLYGMFFAMSFALMRGYHDPPLAAGLRLTIIPIALGVVAPFSGALYELGPRLVKITGMVICIVAVTALTAVLTGEPGSLPGVMIALAAFGAGLGMFIAANNTATISAAPADKSGQAGGLLNLMRVFGTSLGVATASALLSWRLGARTGTTEHTVGMAGSDVLGAIDESLWLLIAFAGTAGVISLLQGGRLPPAPQKHLTNSAAARRPGHGNSG